MQGAVSATHVEKRRKRIGLNRRLAALDSARGQRQYTKQLFVL